MRKIISLLLSLCFILTATPAFAENNKFKELEDKFKIVEKTFASYEIVRDFNSENFTVDEESILGYTTGMFDYNGNEVIPSEYNYLELFYEDLAVAQKLIFGRYGYIDKDGKWAIPPIFSMCDRFSEGLAYVYMDGQSGYIDKTGKVVHILAEEEYGSRFYNGMAIISSPDNVRIVNKNFETINSFPTNETSWNTAFFSERFILWSYDNETGDSKSTVIDKDGKEYYSVKNGNIDNFIDGKAVVSEEDSVKLIDIMGNVLVEKKLTEPYSYFVRVCEGINVENPYIEDAPNTLIFYDDDFNEIARYQDYYITVEPLSKSMLFSPENMEDAHYFFLNKTKENKEIPKTEYSTYYNFETNNEKSVMALKIGDPKVFVNDDMFFLEWDTSKDNYTAPFIENGRTMVPVRFISENFGADGFYVDYFEFGNYQKVTISNTKQIELVIGDKEATVTDFNFELNNYETKTEELDVAPVIKNDRTFVPIRFISETMGLNVEWDPRGYVIIGDKNLLPNDVAELFESRMDISEYPIIDGSTATLPISRAITENMLNISHTAASYITNHTKTENAFNNLIKGNVDMLITGTPNKTKIQKAKDAGMDLESYPFAKDAFVFIVHKDNPVDTLTSEQLRKIYSGEITNWKEVGGNDAEIIPYQRNEDSGSQNLMKKFMGTTPLMKPVMGTIDSMGEIIDVVAEYDNNINSIGYTVNYYMSEMHFSDEIKTIKLDGIEANDENIRTNKYPQVLEYAIVFNAAEPKDSSIRKIIEFLKTESGIQLIKDTNFISIK